MERAQKLLDQLVYIDGEFERETDKGKVQEEAGNPSPSHILPSPVSRSLPAATPDLNRSWNRKRHTSSIRESEGKVTGTSGEVCRTWSRDDLLRRLRTYSTRTWFCKPAKVSEAVCASKGWVNTGVDTLECEACKARAAYPSCVSPSPKAINEIADRFVPLLDSLHHKFCPWKGNVCDLESLLRFPLMAPAKMVEDLKHRMENLCTVRCLPRINPDFLQEAFSLSQGSEGNSSSPKMKQILDKKSTVIQNDKVLNAMLYHNKSEMNTESYQASLLILAMCGWDCTKEDSKHNGASKMFRRSVLQCSMCGSRAGIWNFDKEVERPCELDYISWKQNNVNNPNRCGASSSQTEGLPTHSLRGSAKATGYTCLTSPLYVASPVMMNLFKTIAGGDTLASSGLPLDFGEAHPQHRISTPPQADKGHQRKKQKRELLNTRDPGLCRSEMMHPLNGHKKYCPWRYSMAAGKGASPKNITIGARPGWIQCVAALAPNECDHPQHEETNPGGHFPGQEDLVSMLNKVQKTIS